MSADDHRSAELSTAAANSDPDDDGFGEDVFIREVCEKYFSFKADAQHHYLIGGEKPLLNPMQSVASASQEFTPPPSEGEYNCKLCKKSFLRKQHFERHTCTSSKARVQGLSKPARQNQSVCYICGACGKKFSSRQSCEQHTCSMIEIAPTEEVQTFTIIDKQGDYYVCKGCRKRFATTQQFESHPCNIDDATEILEAIEVPMVGYDFLCKVCGQVFSEQHEFESHCCLDKDLALLQSMAAGEVVTVSNCDEYVCSECNESFDQKTFDCHQCKN